MLAWNIGWREGKGRYTRIVFVSKEIKDVSNVSSKGAFGNRMEGSRQEVCGKHPGGRGTPY